MVTLLVYNLSTRVHLTSFLVMSGVSEAVTMSVPIILFTCIIVILTFVIMKLVKTKETPKIMKKDKPVKTKDASRQHNKTDKVSKRKEPSKIVSKQNHPYMLTALKGHTNLLTSGDLSPSGKYFITASQEESDLEEMNKSADTKDWYIVEPLTPSDTEESVTSTSSSSCQSSTSESTNLTSKQKKNQRNKKKNKQKKKQKNNQTPINNVITEPQFVVKAKTNLKIISGIYRAEDVSRNPSMEPDRSFYKIPKLSLRVDERIMNGYPYETDKGIFVHKVRGYSKVEAVLRDQRLVGAELDLNTVQTNSSSDEATDFSDSSSPSGSRYTDFKFDEDIRHCMRCKNNFRISDNGNIPCSYHPMKAALGVDRTYRYQCCYRVTYSGEGCTAAAQHVYHQLHPGTNGPLEGFKTTSTSTDELGHSNCINYPPTLIGMDCEMVYTDQGFEAARATLVTCSGNIIFDKFIRPKGKIYDYNTKFSGIKESDMDAAIEFEDAQDQILALVSGKDTLVGHSLESDLVALKIIHRRILDTSLLFDVSRNPNSGGSVLRRQKLKSLVNTYLNYDIQTSFGHCSLEDATATLNLVFFYLSEFTAGFF